MATKSGKLLLTGAILAYCLIGAELHILNSTSFTARHLHKGALDRVSCANPARKSV